MTRELIEQLVEVSKKQIEIDKELGTRCLNVVQPILDSKDLNEMKEARFYVIEFFGNALDYSVEAIVITEKINKAIKDVEADGLLDGLLDGIN